MSSGRKVLVLVVGVVLAILLLRMRVHGDRQRDPHATRDVEIGDETALVPSSPVDRAAAVTPSFDRRRAFELGARVRIPPPGVASSSDAGAPTHHPRALAPGGGGFVDRRENPGPDLPNMATEIQKRMAEVRAAAARCLDGWTEEDPSLAAGVVLAISVDERGLKDVWIMDRAAAPSGPLACLSNAVYPIDWSGLTKDPMKITVKVSYAPLDAGTTDASAADAAGTRLP